MGAEDDVELVGQNHADARAERRRRVAGGRPHRHSVRLTNEEQELVAAAAQTAQVTVPHLIAETVLLAVQGRGQLSAADRRALADELAGIRRFLSAISRNVNQQTAAAHSTGQLPGGETEATMRAVADMVQRLDALIAPYESSDR